MKKPGTLRWLSRLTALLAMAAVAAWVIHSPTGDSAAIGAVCLGGVLGLIWLLVRSWAGRVERAKAEFWIDYMHDYKVDEYMPGEPICCYVRYEEGEVHHNFFGDYWRGRPHPNVNIFVPDAAKWDAMVPVWLRGRRDLVVERLRQFDPDTVIITERA